MALYVAGRLHTPNYTFSLFGRAELDAVALKSMLASIALGAGRTLVPGTARSRRRRLSSWAGWPTEPG